MSGKYALLIGTSEYTDDDTLSALPAVANDLTAMRDVLLNPQIGAFDKVDMLPNAPAQEIRDAIEDHFQNRHRDDLVLLYFAGHGLKDSAGRLYLSATNTQKHRLGSRGVASSFVNDQMNNSGSRRQVLILDCCHAAAFAKGSMGGIGGTVDTGAYFDVEGYGRYILTASDAVQAAWQGDTIITDGTVENSLFTHFLLQGLTTGAADSKQDGFVDVEELFEYASNEVLQVTSKQTPKLFTDNRDRDLILAKNPDRVVLMTRNETPKLDLYTAMMLYESLYAAENWDAAFQILLQIQNSGLGTQRWIRRETEDLEKKIASTVSHYGSASYGSAEWVINNLVEQSQPKYHDLSDILSPPFDWCHISVGKVTLHGGGYIPANGMSFELGPFSIAKYPVTNGQFAQFIDDGGYDDNRWWSDHGWQERIKGEWTKPRYWKVSDWDADDYPVTGISWYEATAYCNWLSDLSGQKITLLTEQQWQWAAQGTDARVYPWGNDFENDRCNTAGSGIGRTTPVTRYSGKGDSPGGVVDMSGNVWEWCLTEWEKGDSYLTGNTERVLRGGAWNSNLYDARVIFRLFNRPNLSYNNYSFRLCLPALKWEK